MIAEVYWAIGTVLASGLAAFASIFVANRKATQDQEKIQAAIVGDERALFFQELQDLRADNKMLRERERELGIEVADLKAEIKLLQASISHLESKIDRMKERG